LLGKISDIHSIHINFRWWIRISAFCVWDQFVVRDVQKKLSYWLPTNPSCSPPPSLSAVCTLSLLSKRGWVCLVLQRSPLYLRFPINNRAASQLQHVECCRQRVLLSNEYYRALLSILSIYFK
jgi:hypothetical protein